jgi:hypothetical protein
MASSVEDIVNLALILIGQTAPVENLATDGTETADVANRIYPQDRDEVLAAFPWRFARKRVKPAALVSATLDNGDVPTGWEYAFAVPGDAVKGQILGLYPYDDVQPSDSPPFDMAYDGTTGQPIILANDDEPEFVYTAQITDPTQYPPLFVRALAAKLAEDFVLGLRKDPKLGQVAHAYYVDALGKARAEAARDQNQTRPIPKHLAVR